MLCNHCKRDVHFFKKDYGLTCSNCSRVASYFVPAPIYVERERTSEIVKEIRPTGERFSTKARREACIKYMEDNFETIRDMLILGKPWNIISDALADRASCTDIVTFKKYYRLEAERRMRQREAA